MDLECLVTYKCVVYAYEKLNKTRRDDLAKATAFEDATKKIMSKSEKTMEGQEVKKIRQSDREPWNKYFKNDLPNFPTKKTRKFILEPRDSYRINLHRMSSKSDNSVCHNDYYYYENEGEYVDVSIPEEIQTKSKSFNHLNIIEEKINFVQTGFLTQVRIIYNIRKISPPFYYSCREFFSLIFFTFADDNGRTSFVVSCSQVIT